MTEDQALVDRFPALAALRSGSRTRRRVPYVQQTTSSDCGVACLAMVLGYHGKPVRLEEVREVTGVDRDGADARSLIDSAHHYGLRGRGVRVPDIDDLQRLPGATVLHWRFHHFVVLERTTRRGAVIVDPSLGRRVVTRNELRSAFTGIAVTFETTEDFTPGAARDPGLGRYLSKILAQSGLLARVVVISVLLQVLALALPIFTGLLVDRVVPLGDRQLLAVLGWGLAMISVFHFLSSLLRAYLLLHFRTLLDAKISLDFLEHLFALPYTFFQKRSAGDLMMRLNSNSTIREILTSSALSAILDGVLVGLYLVLLFLTHFQMGLLVFGLGLLRIGLFLLTRRRYRELMAEALQASAKSRDYQVQMLSGIETLKVMGAERRAVEHWSHLFVGELNVSLARGRLSAVFDSLLGAIGTASPLVILLFGAHLVLNGELSLGTLLALSAVAMGFLMPLSALVGTAVQMQLLKSYLERIDDVMSAPKEQEGQTLVSTDRLEGRVTIENLSFRYGSRSPRVVRDVSVDIEPGSFVAIVGASGAGKSTLASLLLGLYEPTDGRILYDGRDLATLDLRSLRSRIGVVTQRPFLFGSSIRENLTLTDPTLPLERLVEAARLANIHDEIVAMPLGYDTVLGDGGNSLSGGQSQRLTLARALVHRPSVLLLDEATSNLDALGERRIQDELSKLRATRIVIAHRLSTIVGADRILVMEAGRILESGTYDELMARQGRFVELLASQVRRPDHSSELPEIDSHRPQARMAS